MSHLPNREIERYYFEQFKVQFPLPSGLVEYGDRPDVVINGARIVGIEIANLYLLDGAKPSSEQTQRGFREQVLRLSQNDYLAGGGRKIELSVEFDRTRPITNIRALASSLAHAASSIETLPRGQVERQLFEHIPEVRFIYHNPTEYPDASWRTVQGYEVPSLSLSRIAEILEAKHLKLDKYRACDAYWLLLVVDLMDPAQDQDIEWASSDQHFVSKFEKIIVYKPQHTQWTEVPRQP